MSEIPAGWYPDPYQTPNLYRWWDGVSWTDHTAPMTPEQPQPGSAEPAQTAEQAQPAQQPQQPQQPQEQWHGGGADSGFGQGASGPGFGQAVPQAGFGQSMPDGGVGPGQPGWEPRTEPPPWNTQDGPPVLDDVHAASPAPWSESAPQPAPTTEWQAEQPQSQPEQPNAQPEQAQAPAPQTAAPDATPAHETGVDQQEQSGQELGGGPSGPTWEPPSDVGAWAQPYSDWNAQSQGAPAYQPVEPPLSSGEAWSPPSPGPEGPRYPSEPPKKGRGLLVGALAGGIALVLIIVAAIGVFVVKRNQADDRPSPTPTQTSAQSTAPSSTQPASPAATGPRITAGSISYVQLPAPWEPNDQQQFPEFDTKKGQYQYTQRNPPGVQGGWIANVFVGSLSDQFSYGGPEDLESTAAGLATSVEHSYYKPWKTKRKDLERKKITIDGKQGYQIKFHLDFLNTPKGFAAKGETVLVAVLDSSTGGQGVYISIPDNAKKLEPSFDLVMNSLQVD